MLSVLLKTPSLAILIRCLWIINLALHRGHGASVKNIYKVCSELQFIYKRIKITNMLKPLAELSLLPQTEEAFVINCMLKNISKSNDTTLSKAVSY